MRQPTGGPPPGAPGARGLGPGPGQPVPVPRDRTVPPSRPLARPPVRQTPSGRIGEGGKQISGLPRRMRIGVAETVEVRISRHEIEAITGSSGERTPHPDQIAARAMSIRLRAPKGGFYIEPMAPETQWMENRVGVLHDEYAIWRWQVTPKTKGRDALLLTMSLRSILRDGHAADTPLPDEMLDVRTAGNMRNGFSHVVGWIIAAGIGAAMAVFSGDLVRLALPLISG